MFDPLRAKKGPLLCEILCPCDFDLNQIDLIFNGDLISPCYSIICNSKSCFQLAVVYCTLYCYMIHDVDSSQLVGCFSTQNYITV